MVETIKKEWQAQLIVVVFVFLSLFWVLLQFGIFNNLSLFNHSIHKFFGAIYGFVALWGGIWGLAFSQKWGGVKSVMGKAMILFSLGLFAQEFGQVYLSYIDYLLGIQGQYPSIGDIGFFGSIPLYIYGTILLGRASGVHVGLKSFANKIQAILAPLVMLVIGYLLFLKNYEFDWSAPIRVFLDFGYPLGQAIYVALAYLIYSLSRGILGGIMKPKILFFLAALIMQFLSDYVFLYQSYHGIWSVGGINDYMYLVAYLLMTLALFQMKTVFDQRNHV